MTVRLSTLRDVFRKAGESESCDELEQAAEAVDVESLPDDLVNPDKDGAPVAPDGNLSQQIRDMSVPQKVKLALFGNQIARQLLLRDSNRSIALSVLDNARITENEIADVAKSTSVDDLILRVLGEDPKWMKSYSVKHNLVTNPKTPIDISLKWIKFLRDKDLKNIARSKNVPQIVATQARKITDKRQA